MRPARQTDASHLLAAGYQDVMVGARVHFGIPKPPDAGVLVAVLGDVDDEPRGAGANVGVRRLDDAAPSIVFRQSAPGNWPGTRAAEHATLKHPRSYPSLAPVFKPITEFVPDLYGALPVKRLFLGSAASSLFGAGKAVLRPVACDQVPGARGRGQGTETLAKLGGFAD